MVRENVPGSAIDIKNLTVAFPIAGGIFKAVDDVNLTFSRNECSVIIGETGCGKSVLGQAVLGLLPDYAQRTGQILFDGEDIFATAAWRENFYGKTLGIIPQNPDESFNPVRRIGRQFDDCLKAAGITDSDNSLKTAALKNFALDDGERVLAAYPHELSGGMQQRVLCAFVAAIRPRWILADEPTKGLDKETVGTVYENLLKIKNESGAGLIIITHDINLARYLGDTVCVMYAGEVVERSSELFMRPRHPYTKAFLAALPENGFQPLPEKITTFDKGGQANPAKSRENSGCKFCNRCAAARPHCTTERPPIKFFDNGGFVRCFIGNTA